MCDRDSGSDNSRVENERNADKSAAAAADADADDAAAAAAYTSGAPRAKNTPPLYVQKVEVISY
jgi:hypothetical protein